MIQLSRRKFLAMAGVTGAAALGGFSLWASIKQNLKKVTILHTNDTHSRLDPFPASDPQFPGMGGYARRAAFVRQARLQDPELLLLDSGDIFQGTPYFNLFGGVPELKLMSQMGYDAATMGNHEFDNGLQGFYDVLPNAQFPFVSSNYDFSRTQLHDKVKPHLVFRRNGVKIGIYGLGINLAGLVSPVQIGDTVYLDPVEMARETESQLKNRHNCDLIICLSHLGFQYSHDQISDMKLAGETYFTDVILGGHTHTLLDPPVVANNARNQPVTIAQTGFGGVRIGLIEAIFNENTNEKFVESNTKII
ncbi:MAG TPA: metallophosphatase [Bacteroidales bacterium]|nr:metallophosphatase [Bacteroidales bacterium]